MVDVWVIVKKVIALFLLSPVLGITEEHDGEVWPVSWGGLIDIQDC